MNTATCRTGCVGLVLVVLVAMVMARHLVVVVVERFCGGGLYMVARSC